jgi:enediyne polyketide synthase
LTFHHKSSTGPLFVHARECSRQDNTFTYNLCVFGSDGYVHERWEGLRLRVVADKPIQGPCDESIMGPYIERRMQELIPGTAISVAFVRSAETDRQMRSDGAIQIALREKTEVLRRPDGKPEVCFGHFVSASHAGDLTLAIAGPDPLGCDIERVVDRTASQWLDLLGENRFALANLVAKNLDEALSLSATRIWTATEALTKVGMMTDAPTRLDSLHATDWALFSSGSFKIASFPMQIRDNAEKLVLSVVTQLVSGK